MSPLYRCAACGRVVEGEGRYSACRACLAGPARRADDGRAAPEDGTPPASHDERDDRLRRLLDEW